MIVLQSSIFWRIAEKSKPMLPPGINNAAAI
jgi:hypothetical protein